MQRKLFSVLFLLTAIVIGLGVLGHSLQWGKHVQPALTGVAPQVIQLLALIWYWASGTMLVFGLLLIWTWQRIQKGDRNLFFIPWTVAVFYLLEGIYGALYLGPFFSLFIVLGVLLGISTWGLQRASASR